MLDVDPQWSELLLKKVKGQAALTVYCWTTLWGRYGFDDGNETCGACRDDSQSRKSKAVTK